VDEPTAFKVIVYSAAVVTIALSGGAIWLALFLARTSSEAVNASADAARSIAASADKIEAMLVALGSKQRIATDSGRRDKAAHSNR
jgi:hypothetical protein